MHNITLIPGDGIGKEVTSAACKVIEASGVSVNWDIQEAGASMIERHGTPLPPPVIQSIKKNRIALKGPITTPIGSGFSSVNVALRKAFDLYANVRPCRTLPGVSSRYEKIDLVIIRENIEDLYAGVEHMVGDDAAESIKIITRKGSERIVKFAFDYAVKESRSKVTVVHKANIMKYTDGLFLEVARNVAERYPSIQVEEMIVDAMCMKLVQVPERYDVLVMPNLYGDILSDLCAGLVGGLGVAPGANIGDEIAIFEPVHGSSPKNAGKNMANPTATILSGVLMLKHLGEIASALKIEKAVMNVLKKGRHLTYDLGGSATTDAFTDAIISELTELTSLS